MRAKIPRVLRSASMMMLILLQIPVHAGIERPSPLGGAPYITVWSSLPGNEPADGPGRSPFAAAWLEALRTPQSTVLARLNDAAQRLEAATSGKQRMHWTISGALPAGDFGTARSSATTGHAGLALLIGNANYGARKLSGPCRETRELESVFAQRGFVVIQHCDLSLEAMTHAIESFEARLQPGEIGVMHFAGFAGTINGATHLVPVSGDTPIRSSGDVDTLPLARLTQITTSHRAALLLFVVDGGWSPLVGEVR